MAAGIAAAEGVDGAEIVLVAGGLDDHLAVAGEDAALAGVAGRHHAVEHIHPVGDVVEQVAGGANPHQVAGFVLGQDVIQEGGDAKHILFGFAHREAADGIAREIHLHQLQSGTLPQVFIDSPLHDAKEGLAGGIGEGQLAALRPFESGVERSFHILAGGGKWRAFVETHDDVRAQGFLNGDNAFRSEEMAAAVDVGLELHAFAGDLAQAGKAHDLESAAVREHRPVPGDELVKPPGGADKLVPGTQIEMVGVPQYDLGVAFLKLVGAHRLYRAQSAHRHEYGGENLPVVGLYHASPGAG